MLTCLLLFLMMYNIMFWNCQGALSPGFCRTFKTLVSNYRLNMVALFEPRISGAKADNFIKKSGFQRSHRVEARGFSGGIWILWDDSFEVDFIINHNQFIHFRIIDSKGCSFWVTAVYASPTPMVRKILWPELDKVAKSVDGPWMIGGDFNAIRRVSEKKGGSARISGVCELFNGWFHRNHLMEPVFKGPQYTWSRGNLSKRLDRVICNEEWMMMNDEAEVFHLPKLNSDHRPVMFRCKKYNSASTGVKPFRFLAPWLTDERFQPFVENNWRCNLHYTNAVADFIDKLGNWNKDIFGNIFKRKKELLARIGGIQRFLEKRQSRSLSKLESKLKRDLEKVLSQEEVLWFQKARREWLVCGDRNTAYFHQKSIERRRRNKVGMIKNDEGQWIHDEAAIKAHAVSYFCNLYTKEGGVPVQYPFTLDFPLIDNVVLNNLIRGVDDAEIRDTVFTMSPMKAPGIDGLHAIFFQTQWHVVGSSVCQLIKDVFAGKKLPKELNQTLLVLIPKINNPDSLKLFRPISLCTVVYKTITKLVANRLKAILPQIIGPAQTSFVPGRHIVENVIVAQEIIHSMRNKGGKTGQMAIKVDLEKAYDRLSWDFIQETLGVIGLPMDLIRIIMECITTVSMQLLWNGELTESFSPSRGIRQGDPLSPYIFVMCIERLSHGINHAVGNGRWKPIRLNRGGIPITHLFFADDLLLLAEATSQNAQVINEVLDNFCVSSGEKVSREKTQIFFSRNVQKGTIREIKNTLGFSVTKNFGKYLGMPILHSRVTKATYQDILDKVQQRLSGWNAKHLSLAGRITLAQSVLQALPIYAMQSTKIPTSVLTKIEQSCKHFIWSGNAEQRKLNLIRWDTLCQPKSCGGLGLKDLSHMNMALLMKIGWGLVNSPNTFWVQVLASKYKVDTTDLPSSLQTRNGSYLWRAVGKVWDHVLKGTRWALGDGKRVKFWWDLWLSEADSLQSYATNPIPDQLINLCVADFSDNYGNWNWYLFAHLLPNHIILKIASIKAPCALSGEDQCYWAYSNTGQFTAKSAYLSLHQSYNVADKSLWNLAWKWNGPQSIRTFIWLAMNNRLKTKSELFRRHITTDANCCSCGHHLEDTIHVLRDCIIARHVWFRLVPHTLWNNFFDLDLTSWIYYNLKNTGLIRRDENWPCIFGVALWRIWYWRNQFIHKAANISVANIVLDITHRAAEINASMENICRPGHERIIKWLKWMAPPWPFFKLNTDGARKISGNASAGGLIRNYCGEWVHGFGMNIGHCTITGAELWGLLQGLQLAWNIGIRQLLVEVDSRCITEILATDTNYPNANSSLIQGIKRLLNMEWQVSLSHCYRETNYAADYLANQALLLPLGVHVFPTPPSGTEGWLLHDVSGTAYPRMVIA